MIGFINRESMESMKSYSRFSGVSQRSCLDAWKVRTESINIELYQNQLSICWSQSVILFGWIKRRRELTVIIFRWSEIGNAVLFHFLLTINLIRSKWYLTINEWTLMLIDSWKACGNHIEHEVNVSDLIARVYFLNLMIGGVRILRKFINL